MSQIDSKPVVVIRGRRKLNQNLILVIFILFSLYFVPNSSLSSFFSEKGRASSKTSEKIRALLDSFRGNFERFTQLNGTKGILGEDGDQKMPIFSRGAIRWPSNDSESDAILDQSSKNGDGDPSRIYWGKPCPKKNDCFNCALMIEDQRFPGYFYFFCGGAIISNRWILTAGHCTPGPLLPTEGYNYYAFCGGPQLNQPVFVTPLVFGVAPSCLDLWWTIACDVGLYYMAEEIPQSYLDKGSLCIVPMACRARFLPSSSEPSIYHGNPGGCEDSNFECGIKQSQNQDNEDKELAKPGQKKGSWWPTGSRDTETPKVDATHVTVQGHGLTEHGGISLPLMCADEMQVVTTCECIGWWDLLNFGFIVNDYTLCGKGIRDAQGPNTLQGSCNGDSGSAMTQDFCGQPHIIATVSFGVNPYGECLQSWPGGYMLLADYFDWIETTSGVSCVQPPESCFEEESGSSSSSEDEEEER